MSDDEAKVRLQRSPTGEWRLSAGPGIKVYVKPDVPARWARVMAEFDEVQREMRAALDSEYGWVQ